MIPAPRAILLVLKLSKIHGIGVFAARSIRAGQKLPLFTRGDWKVVARPEPALRRYCPTARGGGYYAPLNPHRMSIGWYLNHADRPNVDAERGRWRALRYIRAGEELTIDYQFVDETRHP